MPAPAVPAAHPHLSPAVTAARPFQPRVSLESASPDVHVLMPRGRDYVAWHGRKGFAGGLNYRSGGEENPGHLDGPTVPSLRPARRRRDQDAEQET